MFGIKAALFPLYFWLPDSYPTAPSAVTAIFAGLLTKVGVYAIIRTQTLLFPADSRPATLILVVAGATMVVGVLGAIAQDDVKRIFSFYIVSQIGYIIMGLGLFTVAGLAGAVFAIVHHIVVKTTLFLVGGLIEHAGGSSRLHRLGGMVDDGAARSPCCSCCRRSAWPASRRSPASSPSSGCSTPPPASQEWAILAVAVARQPADAVLDLVKIWIAVFWSPAADRPGEPRRRAPPTPRLMVVPTAVLAALTLLIGVGAGPLYDLSDRAAADLARPDGLPRGGAGAMRAVAFAVGLAAIWVLLWGSASPANVLSGLAVGMAARAASSPGLRRPGGRVRDPAGRHRPARRGTCSSRSSRRTSC